MTIKINIRIVFVFVLLLGNQLVMAQTEDGPYVFYRSGKTIVKRITVKDNKAVVRIDTLQTGRVEVSVDGHPDWTFSVKLKPEIKVSPSVYQKPEKLLVLSDIEGEFVAFRSLLLAAKVIDEHYNWTFGKGGLIVAGDLFDRGKQVSQYLWLLYKLEDEANAHGGKVFIVLGNHDIMNRSGDFRYVQPFYFINADLMGESYPALYSADTELGRWLRSKNTIIKVGDLLITHGGVSPEINKLGLSLDDINNRCRPYYATPVKNIPVDNKVFFGPNALFWYRGYFTKPKATIATVDSTLQHYNAKQIIVGHTIVDQNIALYYGGKVLGVDVNEHTGHCAAALLEHGRWYALDGMGDRKKLTWKPENDRYLKID